MKRIATFVLAFLMALSCGLYIPASAQTAGTYASKTICSSLGYLRAGDQSGQLKIDYEVTANVPASSLGVEYIRLYTDTGKYVTSIIGSTTNGLVRKDGIAHMGTYCYNDATPGQYYYAEITVFAVIGTDYDNYTHLTATIKAPK